MLKKLEQEVLEIFLIMKNEEIIRKWNFMSLYNPNNQLNTYEYSDINKIFYLYYYPESKEYKILSYNQGGSNEKLESVLTFTYDEKIKLLTGILESNGPTIKQMFKDMTLNRYLNKVENEERLKIRNNIRKQKLEKLI